MGDKVRVVSSEKWETLVNHNTERCAHSYYMPRAMIEFCGGIYEIDGTRKLNKNANAEIFKLLDTDGWSFCSCLLEHPTGLKEIYD